MNYYARTFHSKDFCWNIYNRMISDPWRIASLFCGFLHWKAHFYQLLYDVLRGSSHHGLSRPGKSRVRQRRINGGFWKPKHCGEKTWFIRYQIHQSICRTHKQGCVRHLTITLNALLCMYFLGVSDIHIIIVFILRLHIYMNSINIV